MADRNITFIEELIIRTKEKRISWDYLDKNKELCKGMNWIMPEINIGGFFSQSESTRFNFDNENSFCAKLGDMYIVLRAKLSSLADLYVIPYTYKKVVKISADEYGEYITRLMNLIQSYFPDANDFINSFGKD